MNSFEVYTILNNLSCNVKVELGHRNLLLVSSQDESIQRLLFLQAAA